MSDFNEVFESKIRDAVKEEVTKILEPLTVLSGFENVNQLTLDEVCQLFRREPNDINKQWIRNACKRGEIPHVKIGESYFFPKSQLILLLLGEWKLDKVEKNEKVSRLSLRDLAREFVG